MEWQVSRYPRLSAQTVKFANKLSHKALNNLELTLSGQPYMLRPDTAVPPAEFAAAVQCSVNGQNMRFGFDSGLCAFLLSDWLPLEDIAALPDDLKKSVMIAALNPLADFFSQHFAGSFSLEDIECQSTHPSQSSLFFNLLSANDAVVGRAFADVDEQTIDTFDKIWQATAKPESPGNIEKLPVWVEVIAAGTTLSLNEFNELREDDIILLDIAFSKLKEVYARISDNICFSSIIDGNRLIIQKLGEVVMASDEQSPIDQEIEDTALENQEIDSDADPMSFSDEDENSEAHLDEPHTDAEHSDEESLESLLSGETSEPASEDADDKQTASRLNDLGELPVELLFVVDQFKTTLKEVEQIKPGYVFELNDKEIGQAEIRANGTPIGIGELVQIEDRAGVRVVKLHRRKETDK